MKVLIWGFFRDYISRSYVKKPTQKKMGWI